MIEPPVLVRLGPCSAATHGVSCDFSTLKLSASKQWLFRPVKEGVTRSFAVPLLWIVNVHVDDKFPLRQFTWFDCGTELGLTA